jgi:hypothetical protein
MATVSTFGGNVQPLIRKGKRAIGHWESFIIGAYALLVEGDLLLFVQTADGFCRIVPSRCWEFKANFQVNAMHQSKNKSPSHFLESRRFPSLFGVLVLVVVLVVLVVPFLPFCLIWLA